MGRWRCWHWSSSEDHGHSWWYFGTNRLRSGSWCDDFVAEGCKVTFNATGEYWEDEINTCQNQLANRNKQQILATYQATIYFWLTAKFHHFPNFWSSKSSLIVLLHKSCLRWEVLQAKLSEDVEMLLNPYKLLQVINTRGIVLSLYISWDLHTFRWVMAVLSHNILLITLISWKRERVSPSEPIYFDILCRKKISAQKKKLLSSSCVRGKQNPCIIVIRKKLNNWNISKIIQGILIRVNCGEPS